MKTTSSILGILGVCLCLWHCEKSSSYPEIPEIHFKKFTLAITGYDLLGNQLKTGTVTFSFIDGDGDIGSRYAGDSSKIYATWLQKKADGTYVPYSFNDTSTIQQTLIPYDDVMNRDDAQKKVLKGYIESGLAAPIPPYGDMDTIRIEFHISDRSLNKSNVAYTPDFSIRDDYVLFGEDPDIGKKK